MKEKKKSNDHLDGSITEASVAVAQREQIAAMQVCRAQFVP